MEKPVSITENRFVELVGRLGVRCENRHEAGSTWRTPEGHLVSERLYGDKWRYIFGRREQ